MKRARKECGEREIFVGKKQASQAVVQASIKREK
jgi:hypothetical protein